LAISLYTDVAHLMVIRLPHSGRCEIMVHEHKLIVEGNRPRSYWGWWSVKRHDLVLFHFFRNAAAEVARISLENFTCILRLWRSTLLISRRC